MTKSKGQTEQKKIKLPELPKASEGTLEDFIYKRRSVRSFKSGIISQEQIAKVIFAAQGITHKNHLRTTPSAGASYPLEIYVATGQELQNIAAGVYNYNPFDHSLVLKKEGDQRKYVGGSCLGQTWMSEAQLIIIICAVFDRLTSYLGSSQGRISEPEDLVYEKVLSQYGGRALQFAAIEAGCAAQNIALQAISVGLATTVVGAYFDPELCQVLGVSEEHVPMLVIPTGNAK